MNKIFLQLLKSMVVVMMMLSFPQAHADELNQVVIKKAGSVGLGQNVTVVRSNYNDTNSNQSWTEWLNRDAPGATGDYETLKSFIKEGKDICASPTGIQCKTLDGRDWKTTGEVYQCEAKTGGICKNADQPDKRCLNYQVRFQCPKTKPTKNIEKSTNKPKTPSGMIERGIIHGANIDAVLTHPNGKAYFFSGDKYYRFNFKTDKVDKIGVIGVNGWKGVPSNIDGAIMHPNGKAYFFVRDKYYRFDFKKDRVEGKAQRIGIDGWKGLTKNIDSVVMSSNGKAYFFADDKYYRFNFKTDKIDKVGAIGINGKKGAKFYQAGKVNIPQPSLPGSFEPQFENIPLPPGSFETELACLRQGGCGGSFPFLGYGSCKKELPGWSAKVLLCEGSDADERCLNNVKTEAFEEDDPFLANRYATISFQINSYSNKGLQYRISQDKNNLGRWRRLIEGNNLERNNLPQDLLPQENALVTELEKRFGACKKITTKVAKIPYNLNDSVGESEVYLELAEVVRPCRGGIACEGEHPTVNISDPIANIERCERQRDLLSNNGNINNDSFQSCLGDLEPRSHIEIQGEPTVSDDEVISSLTQSILKPIRFGQELSTMQTVPYSIIDNFTVASVGDSYASGEGAPDRVLYAGANNSRVGGDPNSDVLNENGLWNNRGCHRSKLNGRKLAVDAVSISDVNNIEYLDVSCSGSQIMRGLTTPRVEQKYTDYPNSGAESPEEPGTISDSQITQVKKWAKEGNRLDVLLISIGGNDVSFASVVKACVAVGEVCRDHKTLKLVNSGNYDGSGLLAQHILEDNNGRGLSNLAESFTVLNDKITQLNPRKVIITGFPNPLLDSNGRYCNNFNDGFGISLVGFKPVYADISLNGASAWYLTSDDSEWITNRVIKPLNQKIRDAASSHGWEFIDVEKAAAHHVMCSGDKSVVSERNGPVRWFNTLRDSWETQGDFNGAAHPNKYGHEMYRDFISKELAGIFKPIKVTVRPRVIRIRQHGIHQLDRNWQNNEEQVKICEPMVAEIPPSIHRIDSVRFIFNNPTTRGNLAAEELQSTKDGMRYYSTTSGACPTPNLSGSYFWRITSSYNGETFITDSATRRYFSIGSIPSEDDI